MHYIPQEKDFKHLGGNTIGGNSQTFYPELWGWMISKLQIKSVLDVGCGEGHALYEFRKLGCETYGIDGLPRNAEIAKAVAWDLTKSPYIVPVSIDLVWCCEVVAQIEEKYIENVLNTLAQGKYLALTVELPGQIGYHHVNCQPIEYWEQKLLKYNFRVDDELTAVSKQHGHHFWSVTGRVYVRK